MRFSSIPARAMSKPQLYFLFLVSAGALAQAPKPDSLVSPEVHPDHRVTFRIRAPKASEVGLFGDWMTPNTLQAMTRDADGVWSVTGAADTRCRSG